MVVVFICIFFNEYSKDELLKGEEVDKYIFNFKLFKKVGRKAKVFDKPDKEWMEFVFRNLIKGDNLGSEYDVIIGPMFNREYLKLLAFQNIVLDTFMEGYYDEASMKPTVITIKNKASLYYIKKVEEGVMRE